MLTCKNHVIIRMEKLTLSIRNKEKIDWVKNFAKTHHTSVSSLFESYVDALKAFDEQELHMSSTLDSLRDPGERPGAEEIEKHLTQRRKRTASERK